MAATYYTKDHEWVRMEGDEHGFRVVVVRPDDKDWAQRVLDAVNLQHAA